MCCRAAAGPKRRSKPATRSRSSRRGREGEDALATNAAVIARLDRATQYAAAARINLRHSGILGPRFRGDDGLCVGMPPMLNLYNKPFASRLLVGSALYPSPKIMQDAI